MTGAGVVITGRGRRGEVRTREQGRDVATEGVAHRHHAEGVAVGREGGTVGDGPTADEAVDEIGFAERRPVDAVDEQAAVRLETLAAERVVATAVTRGPAGDDPVAVLGRVARDITEGDADRAAFVHVRSQLDEVVALIQDQGIQRERRIGGARAGEGHAAALEGDGIGRLDAHRVRRAGRVEAVVIPGNAAIVDLQAGRAGQRARVAELQGAAADDRLADVGLRAGQQRGAAAGAGEGDVARDRAGERAAADGGQADDVGAGVGDRTAHARIRIDRDKGADRLVLVLQVDHGGEAVDVKVLEDRGAGGRRDDRQGVLRAGIQVQPAAVDRGIAAAGRIGVVGEVVEVQHAVVGLDETLGLADAERAADGERRAVEDVDVGREGRRIGREAFVEGRGRARGDEDAGGAGEILAEHAARTVDGTEGGAQAAADLRGAGERERVDQRVLGDRQGGRQAGVLVHVPSRGDGVEFARGQGAETIGHRILDQEARAVTGHRGVGEHVAADRHGGGSIRAGPLPCHVLDVADGQLGDTGRSVGAADAGDDHAAAEVAADVVERGKVDAEGQRERLRGVRLEFDATAARDEVEVTDRLGGSRGSVACDHDLATAQRERASVAVHTEAVIEVAVGSIVQQERAASDGRDRGPSGTGGDEGLARASVGKRATEDVDGTHGAVGVLGPVEDHLAVADLVDVEGSAVVEALESSGERRRVGGIRHAVLEADDEGRIPSGTEDVAGAAERAPDGGRVVQVIATGRPDVEGGEA